MERKDIRNAVLSHLAAQGTRYVPAGVSARHVHLSQEDMDCLFGPHYALHPCKALSQPGQFAAAEKAGLSKILADRKAAAKGAAAADEDVKAPPAEPCTASIPGIEVMDLEDAAKALWKAGIYAETGMGCTGPLVMMSEANLAKSQEILKAAGYIG